MLKIHAPAALTTNVPRPDDDLPSDAPPADEDELISLDFTLPGAFDPVPPVVAPPPPTLLDTVRKLVAAGHTAEARQRLETALAKKQLGNDAERAYLLLLACYQAQGQRETFEARALEFARRFEKSPPAWVESAPAVAAKPALKTIPASIAGTLSARVAEPLRQVIEVCARKPLRLDLARITDVDDAGCALLHAALVACSKHAGHCRLAGAGHLAALLAAKVQDGCRDNEAAWLLLLDLYQRLGRAAEFEAAALAYAVSFEVSPPSWEDRLAGACEN